MKFAKVLVLIGLLSGVLYIGSQSSAQSQLLGSIEVKFCNYDTVNQELDLIAQAGKKLPLCVEYTNTASFPITIHVEFLDSVITDDAIQNRACNAADRPKTQFGNFLHPYDTQITIPPQKTIQKIYTITYPIGFQGFSHGCFAYDIVGTDTQQETFHVVIRAVRYIDIYVAEEVPIQTITITQPPKLVSIDDEYLINFSVANDGNVDEKIRITAVISNILGYQKDFDREVIIPAHSGRLLATPSFILPVYRGLFRFTSTIAYQPDVNFNITDGTAPSELYAGGTKKLQTLFFVRSWQSVVGICILVLLLLVLIRIRTVRIRKLAIKHPPTSPIA